MKDCVEFDWCNCGDWLIFGDELKPNKSVFNCQFDDWELDIYVFKFDFCEIFICEPLDTLWLIVLLFEYIFDWMWTLLFIVTIIIDHMET